MLDVSYRKYGIESLEGVQNISSCSVVEVSASPQKNGAFFSQVKISARITFRQYDKEKAMRGDYTPLYTVGDFVEATFSVDADGRYTLEHYTVIQDEEAFWAEQVQKRNIYMNACETLEEYLTYERNHILAVDKGIVDRGNDPKNATTLYKDS